MWSVASRDVHPGLPQLSTLLSKPDFSYLGCLLSLRPRWVSDRQHFTKFSM
jgi:hypothetical protein